MTKENLPKEILAKVKPGTKPSDIKKLKRSKSADDIPAAPASVPLTKSQSNPPLTEPKYPYTTLIAQQSELARLHKETETKSTTISLLRKKLEELEKSNPPTQLLSDQLQTKQKEIESLRKQLEENHTPPELSQLDNSLFARHKSLKDWFSQYQKNKKLDQELSENIDQASSELINQDQTISQLRGQIAKWQRTNQSLQKDLDLATKLAELRKSPLPNPDPHSYHSQLLVYAFLAVWLITLLNRSWQANFKDN